MMNPRCRRLATSRAERGCPFGQTNGRSTRCMEAQGPSPTVERPFAWNAPAVHPTLDPQVGADVCAEICRERHRKPGVLLPSGARGPGGWSAGTGRLERGDRAAGARGPGGWSVLAWRLGRAPGRGRDVLLAECNSASLMVASP